MKDSQFFDVLCNRNRWICDVKNSVINKLGIFEAAEGYRWK